VSALVQTGEFARGFLGPFHHHLGQRDLVDKACGQSRFTEERLRQPGGLLIRRARQPQLHDFQRGVGDDHADRDLVGLNVARVRGHSVIAGRQQERAHRDGVAGARHHHRLGVRQQAI